MKKQLTILLLLFWSFSTFGQMSGIIDNTFNSNANGGFDVASSSASPIINTIAIQADKKIIVGGKFNLYKTNSAKRIIRIDSLGNQDFTFNNPGGTGFNSNSDEIEKIKIQSDGKIIVIGNFSTYNGVTVNGIVRLNANATIDNTFTSPSGTTTNLRIYDFVIHSNGKITLVGFFATYNGVTVNNIVRLNANGTIDNTFVTGTAINGALQCIALQQDDKIVVGGSFSSYNGTAVNDIVRINSNGSIDNSFNVGAGLTSSSVNSMAIQSDGKILVGGNFNSFNNFTKHMLVRLNSDGTYDTAFNSNNSIPPQDNSGFIINSIVLDNAGSIFVGGKIKINSNNQGIVRFNSNGTIKTTFSSGVGINGVTGTNYSNISAPSINCLALLPSGKQLYIGGEFGLYNNTALNCIGRLSSCETTTITPSTSVLKLCNSGFASFTATTTSNGVINWYSTASSTTPSFTGANYNIGTVNTDKTYYVESSDGMCKTARLPVYVKVDTVIPTITSYKSNSRCTAGTITLEAYSDTGKVYWSNATNFNPIIDSGSVISYFFNSTHIRYARGILGGCRSAAVSVNAKLISNSNFGVTLNYNSSTNKISSTLTSSSSPNNLIYQWYNCSNNALINGADSSSFSPTSSGSYKVTVSGNGCSATSTCISIIPNDIPTNKFSNSKLNIYPNPTNDIVNIEINNELPVSIEIINNIGQVVKQETFKKTLSLQELPQGVYMLKLIFEEGNYSLKEIVIE